MENNHNLAGKIAVLTGGGGGIGRALAVKLAQCGMRIVLVGGNNPEKLNATASAVKPYGSCIILPGDLTNPDFIKQTTAKITADFPQVDVLINNAGVAQSTPFEEITIEEFDKIMAINTKAPFMMIQSMLPLLKKSAAATIINIASVVAHSGYPLQSIYTASKHALLGMTKSLAAEYYQENIRVHAISPGGVYTDMVKVSRPDLTPDGMILPEEVADIIHFLLANRNNAVIDEIILHRVNKQPFLV